MTFSMTPLFRHTVGFDHLDHLFNSLTKIDQSAPSYPPYNIEKLAEDNYRITLAVAGFGMNDLSITAQGGELVVSGRHAETPQEEESQYLHKGIATRAFERKFSLADHVKVIAAELQDGLLRISLVREIPEAAKPRMIEIKPATSKLADKRKN